MLMNCPLCCPLGNEVLNITNHSVRSLSLPQCSSFAFKWNWCNIVCVCFIFPALWEKNYFRFCLDCMRGIMWNSDNKDHRKGWWEISKFCKRHKSRVRGVTMLLMNAIKSTEKWTGGNVLRAVKRFPTWQEWNCRESINSEEWKIEGLRWWWVRRRIEGT